MYEMDDALIVREPIGRVMSKISRMFLAEIRKNLEGLDIERSFYPLLLIEAHRGITQNELATLLSCDKVQVVRIIDYLSSIGYVERTQNADDRRKYSLEITDKAKRHLPAIRKAVEKTSASALVSLTEDHIDELYSILSIIDRNLSHNLNS